MEGLSNVVIIFGVVVLFERFSLPEAIPSLVTKYFLTTPRVRDGNLIPKPTSYMRRLSVEPDKQSSSTPYGLGVTEPHRRSKHNKIMRNQPTDIWKWDYWCQLQSQIVQCDNVTGGSTNTSYYYEAQVDTCKIHLSAGCNSTKNYFVSLEDCQQKCKDSYQAALRNLKNSDVYCSLQPNVGTCFAFLQRYYYNIKTKECKNFIYGGCGGNQNRFVSMEQCEKHCKKDMTFK